MQRIEYNFSPWRALSGEMEPKYEAINNDLGGWDWAEQLVSRRDLEGMTEAGIAPQCPFPLPW